MYGCNNNNQRNCLYTGNYVQVIGACLTANEEIVKSSEEYKSCSFDFVLLCSLIPQLKDSSVRTSKFCISKTTFPQNLNQSYLWR